MEYVVPLIILLVVLVAVVVAARLLGRRNQQMHNPTQDTASPSHPPVQNAKLSRQGREITRESAQAASARLTPESHQRVYSLIAQRQVMNAVKEYRKATHVGLGDAAAAVAALAEFPQPTPEPTPQPAPEPLVPDINTRLTVEDIINAAPVASSPAPAPEPAPTAPAAPTGYRYRAIVSRGEDIREVVSTRLNEAIFGEIRQLALSGNYDGAARLLREHADIGETAAQEFVIMITPED